MSTVNKPYLRGVKKVELLFSDFCRAKDYSVDKGTISPNNAIEGGSLMVTCNLGFKIEGSWQFECRNGKLQDKTRSDKLPTCVPIKIGMTIKESIMCFFVKFSHEIA